MSLMRGSIVAALVVLASASDAMEPGQDRLRCGWFDNPSPGNATLRDRDGEWIIAVQGGHEAEGDWPSFKPSLWVKIGAGSYGYGCACMKVRVGAQAREVVAITAAQAQPLTRCRRDKSLAGVERLLR